MLQKIFRKNKGVSMVISKEKISEVNKLLEEGYSLNRLDQEGKLGCSRRAFCNNAKKIGYVYNKSENKFITLEARETEEIKIKAKDKREEPKRKKSEALTLEELDNRLKKIEELVLQGAVTLAKDNLEIDKDILEDEIVSRTFKVSKGVLSEFDAICKTKLAAYSKKDILSQALKEFIDKYK